MNKAPSCLYRVSIKGLILDETGEKFLITREDNNKWELPGGGMDEGESPEACLKREIQEEMSLSVTQVAKFPSYQLIGQRRDGSWATCLVYEAKVSHLNFTPSPECEEIRFVSPQDVDELDVFFSVRELAKQFSAERHT